MEARTRTETVTFRQPFRLASQPGVMPAGAYTIQVEEELIDGLSFPAWRRTIATLTRQGLAEGRLRQCWTIRPTELDAALAADGEAGR